MKVVFTHYVQMETFEVPDECPTDSEPNFILWLERNGGFEKYLVKRDTRDWEIVEVQHIETDNETNGRFG